MLLDTATYSLGLDVGSNYIKALELRKGSEGVSVSDFGLMEKDPDRSDEENLREFAKENSFSVSLVSSSISGRFVLVRYVNIKEDQRGTLEEALNEQVSRYLPFDVDQAYIDYQVLEESPLVDEATGEGESRILLVAVKRDTINSYADLLESAGYAVNRVEVDALALGNAYEFYQEQSGTTSNTNVGLVDIGARRTTVHVMNGQMSLFAREFQIGGNDCTSAIATRFGVSKEEAEEKKVDPRRNDAEIREAISDKLEDLCHEIHLSFDYFETEYGQGVDRLMVSGGSSQLPGLEQEMTDVLQLRPVFWNPFEQVPLDMDTEDKKSLNENARYMAIVTGLAAEFLEVTANA